MIGTTSLQVDHAVIAVPDLEAAAGLFAALGFHVTPPAAHSARMGTANCCVMLPDTYLELIAARASTPLNACWRQLLALGGGLRGLALRQSDMDAAALVLRDGGVPCAKPVSFSRALSEVDGAAELRFTVLRVEQTTLADLHLLFCRHDTPALLWRPETMRHENGATALRGIARQTANPEAAYVLPDVLRRAAAAALPAPARSPPCPWRSPVVPVTCAWASGGPTSTTSRSAHETRAALLPFRCPAG
jgi:hypothetical protein